MHLDSIQKWSLEYGMMEERALFANLRLVLKCTHEMGCQLAQWSAADETNSYGRLLDAMCRWRKKGRPQLSETHHIRQLLSGPDHSRMRRNYLDLLDLWERKGTVVISSSLKLDVHCTNSIFFCSLLLIGLYNSIQMICLVNSDSVVFC